MSKKSTTETRTAPVTEPKPVAIPNSENHPSVIAVRTRYESLNAKLTAIRTERRNLERELQTKPGESDVAIEAKRLARGLPTDAVDRLREVRRSEQVTEQAMQLVATEVKDARESATRELSAVAREELFIPAARVAVKDWLDAVKKLDAFRQLVDDIRDAGVGNGLVCPFIGPVPLTLNDREQVASFVRDLVSNGYTDINTVNSALSNIL